MNLTERVAIVTGAGGGIGRAIALRLAAEGASVLVADIVAAGAEETVAQIDAAGGRAAALIADVSERTAVEGLVAETIAQFGCLDLLVNNAGLLGRTPLLAIDDATWERFMAVNVRGPFLCCQAAARWWLAQGRRGAIVNIASVESEVAFPEQVPYATSKGGLLMMTRALALDLAPHRIRVNAVGPGTIDSHGSFAQNPERRAAYEALYPLGRLGRPADIAGAVAFLASDDADWITGQILYVDGGYLIR